MLAPRFPGLVAACLLMLVHAAPALAESKHFQASQRHFEDIASMAATLSGQVDTIGEKNLCNYFTATAMAYAIRAHAMAQLADVRDTLRQPEAKNLLDRKISETGQFVTMHAAPDISSAEGLASSSGNTRIRKLGMRLVNELRVFTHNVTNAVSR